MKRLLSMICGLCLGAALSCALLLNAEPVRLFTPAFDARAMSADPPLPIPTLAAIIGDAVTDADAQAAILSYYERHADVLMVAFNETDDTRLRALFGMYITHLAVPYNTVQVEPQSLLEFAAAPAAHCGTYATAQARVYDALGLTWRIVHVDGGWHGLVEAQIRRRYEIFDSTSNVWVNRSVGELLGGMERAYRAFYTPILDSDVSDVYRAHLQTGYSVPELRAGLPQWGITIFPGRWEVVEYSAG